MSFVPEMSFSAISSTTGFAEVPNESKNLSESNEPSILPNCSILNNWIFEIVLLGD